MNKYEMIEKILETYDTDSVTLQNARNYLSELSDAEVQENYDDRITYALLNPA